MNDSKTLSYVIKQHTMRKCGSICNKQESRIGKENLIAFLGNLPFENWNYLVFGTCEKHPWSWSQI